MVNSSILKLKDLLFCTYKSEPSSITCPELGFKMPPTILIKVVFPFLCIYSLLHLLVKFFRRQTTVSPSWKPRCRPFWMPMSVSSLPQLASTTTPMLAWRPIRVERGSGKETQVFLGIRSR